MRLQFTLNKINIDPVCHVQILRHAEQQENKNAIGQVYGALYENQAHVTNVLVFPDNEKTSAQQLQIIERRYEDYLNKFNMDQQNLGWYFISYKRNFWDQLQDCKNYQKYNNTSFFLVFDYKARINGKNPYKAFRLKDQFALKETFKWSDLSTCDFKNNNPFIQIPAAVRKNDLFQGIMLFNKDSFVKEFTQQRTKQQQQNAIGIKAQIEDYSEIFNEQMELQKYLNQTYGKGLDQGQKLNQKNIAPKQFCAYLGKALQLEKHEQFFKNYQQNLKTYQKVFQTNN